MVLTEGHEQLPNGTLYPDIINHLRNLLTKPELRGQTTLNPDATSGGGIFLDHLSAARLAAPIVPVGITPGTGPWTQVNDRYAQATPHR